MTLLYSGNTGNVAGNWQLAESIGQHSGGKVVTIGETAVGSLQNHADFQKALLDAIGEDSPRLYRELDAGIAADGRKVESIWDRASRRLAQGATGDVRTLTSLAEDHKVFASTELPAILDNPKVTHLNGVPIDSYRQIYAETPGGMNAKLSEVNQSVQASSRELARGMRWTDTGGEVPNAGRFRVDPGQLFEGTPYDAPPRVAANAASFDMATGPQPFETPEQIARMAHGRERLALEVDTLARRGAHGATEALDHTPRRLHLPSATVLKGLGVAGMAYGIYEGYGELTTAIDGAQSTRDLHVRAAEAATDLGVRSAVSGSAGFVGGVAGGAAGSLVAPGPGTVGGAIVVGGAAAYGAEKAYEESRVQQWSRTLGRELGELSYDHFSREGRLLQRLEGLQENLVNAASPARRMEIQRELETVGEAFKTEADKNNAYFEGRGLIEKDWEAMSARFPGLDKSDVVDAYEVRLEAGKRPAQAAMAGYSDAVHAEVAPRGLPYVPDVDYGSFANGALQQAQRRYSQEVRADQREATALSQKGPEASPVPFIGGWIGRRNHTESLETLNNEQWRDRGHLSAIEDAMRARGLEVAPVNSRTPASAPEAPGAMATPRSSTSAADTRINEAPVALSPVSQRLVADSERAVGGLADKHGLPWDQGLENTSYAVAASARGAGMTEVNLFRVTGGLIRAGQHDGHVIRETALDASQAANTPKSVSVQTMVELDHQTRLEANERPVHLPVQALEPESSRSMA
ncbi:hypothetical protein [Hydrogenophaga crassostreae]|uniref:hypothetical protein n=1 Tax=Hydrogenophaga crassostreae TaxID=1763535 RepID=UPI0012F7827B|nr:hypothetical protein [Hydrogenophaga crassostreae]